MTDPDRKLSEVEEAAVNYSRSPITKHLSLSAKIYSVPAFKAGAKWQRNHVWHNNTEFPYRGLTGNGWGETCLLKLKCKTCNEPVVAQSNLNNGYFSFCDNRGNWIIMSDVIAWAYAEDILPTSLGGTKMF